MNEVPASEIRPGLMGRRDLLIASCALALGCRARAEGGEDLASVRARGALRVAVYKEFAPFSDQGHGIDVEIGQALSAALGLRAEFLPFDAEEKVEDDLRNMVWRGTLLGYGPADVMLHVPVDPEFARRSPQVRIFGPYYRERLQLVRNLASIPRIDTLDALRGHPVGAEDGTLASIVLLSTDGGRLASDLRHFHSTALALDELKAGRLDAVMGLSSELQYGIAGHDGFAISSPAAPGLAPGGWRLGLAVKADRDELGNALQGALDALAAAGKIEQIFKKYNVSWTAP
jgi:ABC-type amino acid transport substrate-binding protein